MTSRKRPVNLHNHPKAKVKGTKFRYLMPKKTDGSPGSSFTIDDDFETACDMAEYLNSIRDQLTDISVAEQFISMYKGIVPNSTNPKALNRVLKKYVSYLSETDPVLHGKITAETGKKSNSYYNGFLITKRFAKYCEEKGITVDRINGKTIEEFWASLTLSSQHKFIMTRRFLSWILNNDFNRNITPENFNTIKLGGTLNFKKADHDSERYRLRDLGEFWAIYKSAGKLGFEFLQDAMLLALFTCLRESDVLSLRRDQGAYDGKVLRKSILKSHNSKGEALGTNLYWDLDKHKTLGFLLERMERRAKSHNDCPFFVCHRFDVRRLGNKEHFFQVTNSFMQHSWSEARDETGLWNHLPPVQRPGFNNIRSLASNLCLYKFGYDIRDISVSMAHSNPHKVEDGAPITNRYTTVGYQLVETEHTLVINGSDVELIDNMRQDVCVLDSKSWASLDPGELQKLLWTKPIVKIAEEFDQTDRNVYKMIKHFNLVKPKMGFWKKVDSGKVKHPNGQVLEEHIQ